MKPKLTQIIRHLISCRQFYILIVALSFIIFNSLSAYPLEHLKRYSYLSFTLFGLLIILSFPIRLIPGVFICGAVLTSVLTYINEQKVALTRMPLTFLDFKISMSNPEGVIEAVEASNWTVYALAVLGLVFLFMSLRALVPYARRLTVGKDISAVRLFRLKFLAFVFLLISIVIFSTQYIKIVKESMSVNVNTTFWYDETFAYLARDLTIWGFIIYSYHLEQIDSGDYYDSSKGDLPPTDGEIREAVEAYLNNNGGTSIEKPNIIVVLAESTFNPSDGFSLSEPLQNQLFLPNKYTQAIGQMYVNAVGGGTWITEFESMTGIDSRLFGYTGFYTHMSLSPNVKESFITYLRNHGYITEAYYAIEGDFYNAANAYKNYGFDVFLDNIGNAGWSSTDEQVIDSIINISKPTDKPFFKYIVTIENHTPHKCKNFGKLEDFVTTFDGLDEFNEANCILNEYIRLTKSTERAYLKLIEYLENQEKLTGRPFVLLIFGDHIPSTFEMGEELQDDSIFKKYRINNIDRKTFFHIASSIPDVLDCCGDISPHVTLMPTLLSAYVASNPDELYLGVNLYNYRNCGSDFLNNKKSSGVYGTISPEEEKKLGKCSVYEKLLTSYRNSGILEQRFK